MVVIGVFKDLPKFVPDHKLSDGTLVMKLSQYEFIDELMIRHGLSGKPVPLSNEHICERTTPLVLDERLSSDI